MRERAVEAFELVLVALVLDACSGAVPEHIRQHRRARLAAQSLRTRA
jgi:hypothetical protein